jgi:hypothetical protein
MYLISMYIPTKDLFKNEIQELKNDLILNKFIKIKDEGVLSNDIINIISEEMNLKIYKLNPIKEDIKNIITKSVIENNLIKSTNTIKHKNKVLQHDEEFKKDYLNIIKEKAIFEIDSAYLDNYSGLKELLKDQFLIIKDNKFNLLEEKIKNNISDEIKDYSFDIKSLSLIVKFGGDINALKEIFRIKEDNYKLQLNQLTSFQKKVLKSRILFKNKTSKEVKFFVKNMNSSSILDALSLLVTKNILNENLEFQDNIFKFWIIENFDL